MKKKYTLQQYYNLASVFSSGTNFCVSIILPVILSFPFINATCGLSLPSAISTISESATVSVVSALTPFGAPSYTVPLLQSSAAYNGNTSITYNKGPYHFHLLHSLETCPFLVILYAKIALIVFALAGSAVTRSLIASKMASLCKESLAEVRFVLTTIFKSTYAPET